MIAEISRIYGSSKEGDIRLKFRSDFEKNQSGEIYFSAEATDGAPQHAGRGSSGLTAFGVHCPLPHFLITTSFGRRARNKTFSVERKPHYGSRSK